MDLYMDPGTAENNQKLVNRKDGKEMVKTICSDAYQECSAKLKFFTPTLRHPSTFRLTRFSISAMVYNEDGYNKNMQVNDNSHCN